MYEGLPYAFYLYGSVAIGSGAAVMLGFFAWSYARGGLGRTAFIDGLLLQLGNLAIIACIPSPPIVRIILLPVATGMIGLLAGRRWARTEMHDSHESAGGASA